MDQLNKRKNSQTDDSFFSSNKRAKNDLSIKLEHRNEAKYDDNEEQFNILADPYQSHYDEPEDEDEDGFENELNYEQQSDSESSDNLQLDQQQTNRFQNPIEKSVKANETRKEKEEVEEQTIGLQNVHEDILKLIVNYLPVAEAMKNLAPVCRQLRQNTRALLQLIQSQVSSVRIDSTYGRRLNIPQPPWEAPCDSLIEGAHFYHPFISYQQQEVGENHRLVVRMKRRQHPLRLKPDKEPEKASVNPPPNNQQQQDDFPIFEELSFERVFNEPENIIEFVEVEPQNEDNEYYQEEKKPESKNSLSPSPPPQISDEPAPARPPLLITADANIPTEPLSLEMVAEYNKVGSKDPVPLWIADPYSWSVLDEAYIQPSFRYDMTLDNLPALNNFSRRFSNVRQLTLVNTAVHFLSPHENDEHLASPLASIWPRLEELHLVGAILPPGEMKSARSMLQELNDLHYLRRLTTTSARLCDVVTGCSALLLARLEELNCRLTDLDRVEEAVSIMTTTTLGSNLRSLGFLVSGGSCYALQISKPEIQNLVQKLAFRCRITSNYLRGTILEQFRHLTVLDFSIGVADSETSSCFSDLEPEPDVAENANFSLTEVLQLLADRLPKLEELIFSYYKRGQKLTAADAEFRLLATEVRGRPPLTMPSVKRVRAAFRAKLHSLPLLKTVFRAAERIDFVLDKYILEEAQLKRIKCRATVNRCDICWPTTVLAQAVATAKTAKSALLPLKRLPGKEETYGQINFFQHYDW